jgi:hypothetical protein
VSSIPEILTCIRKKLLDWAGKKCSIYGLKGERRGKRFQQVNRWEDESAGKRRKSLGLAETAEAKSPSPLF